MTQYLIVDTIFSKWESHISAPLSITMTLANLLCMQKRADFQLSVLCCPSTDSRQKRCVWLYVSYMQHTLAFTFPNRQLQYNRKELTVIKQHNFETSVRILAVWRNSMCELWPEENNILFVLQKNNMLLSFWHQSLGLESRVKHNLQWHCG